MSEHEKLAFELLNTSEDEPFQAFVLLRAICVSKRQKGITREEMNLIYKNYALLLAERKVMQEYKKRLEVINNFVGLR